VLFLSTLQAATRRIERITFITGVESFSYPFLKIKEKKIPLPNKKTVNQIQKLIQPGETFNVLSITTNLQWMPT